MSRKYKTRQELMTEVEELRHRLEEAEQTLDAIRSGAVDALVVSGPEGDQIFTLQGAEHPYRVLVETMNEGAATLAADGTMLYCNHRLADMLQTPLEQVIGNSLRRFVVGTDLKTYEALVAKSLQASSRGELTLRTSQGTPLPVHLSCHTLQIDDEQGICVVITDLTEQKRTEKIIASERLARSILEQASEAILVCDARGTIIRASQMAYKLLQGNPLLQRFDELFRLKNERDGSYFSISVALHGETMQGVELLLERQDGNVSQVLCSARPLRSEENEIIGCIVILTDITERKRAEEALRESEASLVRAQEVALLGNWDWDVKGETLTWSDEVYRIFGVEREFELTYEGIEAMVHPGDREKNQEFVNELLATADFAETEFRVIRPDGAERYIYQNAEVWRDKAGNANRIFGIMQDITARKRAEEELRNSREQLRSLSTHLQAIREKERTRIAREIHDELGQVLTALKIDMSWLKKRFTKDQTSLLEKAQVMEELIDSTIKSVKRIVTELRPGLLDDLGLSAAIEWQAEEFQYHTGIQCDVLIDPENVILKKDLSTAVFRIFQETLTNVARHADATHIHVLLREAEDTLLLEVRDNGKGITKEQISAPNSFGLMGIRERVQFLGGNVTFQGIPKQGTTVTVTIPL